LGIREVERRLDSKLVVAADTKAFAEGERSGRDPSAQRPTTAVRACSGVASRFARRESPTLLEFRWSDEGF